MKERNGQADAEVLRWTGRLLSSDDLRRHLNGHRELVLSARAIVTPMATDELRVRGVRVRREEAPSARQENKGRRLGVGQEKPDALVNAAVAALEREGITLSPLPGCQGPACDWAQLMAQCVAGRECQGGVVFCADPGLVCCVANKLAGLRAVAVWSVPQAARALLTLGANFLAVEMPGRTFFEVRQILKNLAGAVLECPPGVACTLQELEAHAHR